VDASVNHNSAPTQIAINPAPGLIFADQAVHRLKVVYASPILTVYINDTQIITGSYVIETNIASSCYIGFTSGSASFPFTLSFTNMALISAAPRKPVLSLFAATHSSIAISWYANSTIPISSYILYWDQCTGSSSPLQILARQTTSYFNQTGLAVNSSCQFAVVAQNAYGYSQPSLTLQAVAPQALYPLGPPLNITAVPSLPTPSGILLTWTAPGSSTGVATGYILQWDNGGSSTWTTLYGGPNMTFVQPVFSTTKYTFRVAGTNSQGIGAYSANVTLSRSVSVVVFDDRMENNFTIATTGNPGTYTLVNKSSSPSNVHSGNYSLAVTLKQNQTFAFLAPANNFINPNYAKSLNAYFKSSCLSCFGIVLISSIDANGTWNIMRDNGGSAFSLASAFSSPGSGFNNAIFHWTVWFSNAFSANHYAPFAGIFFKGESAGTYTLYIDQFLIQAT